MSNASLTRILPSPSRCLVVPLADAPVQRLFTQSQLAQHTARLTNTRLQDAGIPGSGHSAATREAERRVAEYFLDSCDEPAHLVHELSPPVIPRYIAGSSRVVTLLRRSLSLSAPSTQPMSRLSDGYPKSASAHRLVEHALPSSMDCQLHCAHTERRPFDERELWQSKQDGFDSLGGLHLELLPPLVGQPRRERPWVLKPVTPPRVSQQYDVTFVGSSLISHTTQCPWIPTAADVAAKERRWRTTARMSETIVIGSSIEKTAFPTTIGIPPMLDGPVGICLELRDHAPTSAMHLICSTVPVTNSFGVTGTSPVMGVSHKRLKAHALNQRPTLPGACELELPPLSLSPLCDRVAASGGGGNRALLFRVLRPQQEALAVAELRLPPLFRSSEVVKAKSFFSNVSCPVTVESWRDRSRRVEQSSVLAAHSTKASKRAAATPSNHDVHEPSSLSVPPSAKDATDPIVSVQGPEPPEGSCGETDTRDDRDAPGPPRPSEASTESLGGETTHVPHEPVVAPIPFEPEPVRVIVSETVLQNVKLLRILSADHAVSFVERSLPDPIGIIIDCQTAVCIIGNPPHQMSSEQQCKVLPSLLAHHALRYNRIWIILAVGTKPRAEQWLVWQAMQTSLLNLAVHVHVRFSFSDEQTGHFVRYAIDTCAQERDTAGYSPLYGLRPDLLDQETEWERWLSRLPSVNNMTAQYIVSKTTMRGLLSASTEELAGLLPELPQRCLDHLVMILHTKVSGYVGGLPPNLQTSRALHPPRHTFGTISYGTHYSDHASTEEDGSMVDEIQHKTAHGPGDAPSHRHDLVGVTYTTPAQGRHSTKHTSMSNRTVAPPDSGMREARRRTSPRSTPEARTPSTASSTSIASHLVFHESAGAEFHRLRGRRLAFKGTTGQTRLKWT